MDTKELKEQLEKLKTGLEESALNNILNSKEFKANQKALDDLLSKMKAIERGNGLSLTKSKTFTESFSSKIETVFNDKAAEVKSFQNDKDAKVSFELKDVGVMLTSSHLTGDPVQTYGSRQGLVPNQKVNFRDLIPMTPSATGQYVTYRETGGEGEIGDQTEGSSKADKDYDFTEIKTVTGYVAGLVTFSKQMMSNLPWLQNTLTRALLRDFFKKENSKFYTAAIGAATGFATTSETDDAKAIIDILMGRADQDFNNSFIICKHSQVGRLLKLLYTNGYYAGAGSVLGTPDGIVRIANTPVIGVSWATDDKILVIDNDFIERVETDSLKVDFSYENKDNYEKNLVTARVECMENLNLLRLDAHSYFDLGEVES